MGLGVAERQGAELRFAVRLCEEYGCKGVIKAQYVISAGLSDVKWNIQVLSPAVIALDAPQCTVDVLARGMGCLDLFIIVKSAENANPIQELTVSVMRRLHSAVAWASSWPLIHHERTLHLLPDFVSVFLLGAS